MQKALDIVARHSGDFERAEQGLDMPLYPASISDDCRRLFRLAASGEKASSLRVGKIQIAKLGDCRGSSLLSTLAGGVTAARDLAEKTAGLIAPGLRCPWRAVSPDCVPPLAPGIGSVKNEIGHRFAALATCAEAGDGTSAFVPNDGIGRQIANVSKVNHAPAPSFSIRLLASR